MKRAGGELHTPGTDEVPEAERAAQGRRWQRWDQTLGPEPQMPTFLGPLGHPQALAPLSAQPRAPPLLGIRTVLCPRVLPALGTGFYLPWGWQWLSTVSILVCHPGMGSGGSKCPPPSQGRWEVEEPLLQGPLTLLGPQRAGISQGTSLSAAPRTCPFCARSRLSHHTCHGGRALLHSCSSWGD